MVPRQSGPDLISYLAGSKHTNMKELRFRADDGVWRMAFAVRSRAQSDPASGRRQGGCRAKRFYLCRIARADPRVSEDLYRLERK